MQSSQISQLGFVHVHPCKHCIAKVKRALQNIVASVVDCTITFLNNGDSLFAGVTHNYRPKSMHVHKKVLLDLAYM